MEYSVRFATVKSNAYYPFVVIDGMEYMVPFDITDGTEVSILFRDDLEDGYEVSRKDELFHVEFSQADMDMFHHQKVRSSHLPSGKRRPSLKSKGLELCTAC